VEDLGGFDGMANKNHNNHKYVYYVIIDGSNFAIWSCSGFLLEPGRETRRK